MKEVSTCVKGIKANRIWGILYNKVRRATVINTGMDGWKDVYVLSNGIGFLSCT